MRTSTDLTTVEIAARLGVTIRCVQGWILKGQLSARKRGRDWFVVAKDLDEFTRPVAGWRKGRPRKNSKKN